MSYAQRRREQVIWVVAGAIGGGACHAEWRGSIGPAQVGAGVAA